MSICFEYDDGTDPIQVASNRGWSDFTDWACALPDEDYPDLIHLCNLGWAQGADAIEAQILHALDAFPPRAEGVAEVARWIVSDALLGIEPETTISVVN